MPTKCNCRTSASVRGDSLVFKPNRNIPNSPRGSTSDDLLRSGHGRGLETSEREAEHGRGKNGRAEKYSTTARAPLGVNVVDKMDFGLERRLGRVRIPVTLPIGEQQFALLLLVVVSMVVQQ
jgi:hypothetical protein